MDVIRACDAVDMDLSDMAEYEARERWLLSSHSDCEHVEFDLLDICRMCGRHRAECEPQC
jgi:hypothetical protein